MAASGVTFDITAFEADGDAPSGGAALAEWFAGGLDPARVTLSSDGGGCLPTFDGDGVLVRMDVGASKELLAAIREAVARGVPFEWALAAVTENVATLFRLQGKGRLAVGADADLVVLDDLQVRDVLARGAWLVRDGSPVRRGPFER